MEIMMVNLNKGKINAYAIIVRKKFGYKIEFTSNPGDVKSELVLPYKIIPLPILKEVIKWMHRIITAYNVYDNRQCFNLC